MHLDRRIAEAGGEYLPNVDTVRRVGGEVPDQLAVQPEPAPAKDRTARFGGQNPHADKGVLVPRWGWIEAAGDQPIIGVKRGQRERASVADQGFDFGAPWDGHSDKRGRLAALLSPGCHQARSRIAHTRCEEEGVLGHQLNDGWIDRRTVHGGNSGQTGTWPSGTAEPFSVASIWGKSTKNRRESWWGGRPWTIGICSGAMAPFFRSVAELDQKKMRSVVKWGRVG